MVQAVIPTTVVGLQGRPVASTPAPTNNQALIWNGSAWVPGGPFLIAAGAPYFTTNYVDNSGFTINQRNYGSGGTAMNTPGGYGFDRWKSGASGATLTFTASPASTVVTITAGTVQQVIEGLNFINASYTLSWLGSATGRVNTGAYVASPITFTGAPNTNVTIEFQGGTLGQVLVQLGTQVTLWQPLPVSQEWARCLRFFQPWGVWLSGYGIAGQYVGQTMTMLQVMRVAPTISIGANASSNLTGVAASNLSLGVFYLYGQVSVASSFLLSLSGNLSADL